MKRRRNNRNIKDTIYKCQILLRILLVFLPQTGYIHPDELFQSLEVLAGKILDVQHNPPWEFNVTAPVRSMTIPTFTIGLSYVFLRDFNGISIKYLNQNLFTPYMLLVVPRLLMCLFSFSIDYCLYKLCFNNNEKYKSRLIILNSSYVIFIYGTRTFSNTIELILFSLLLYFVCESLTFNNILIRKKEYINFRYDKSKTTVDKAKFHKLRLYLVSDSYRNCFLISFITVFGFFNRPTFLAFALIPVFFWLYRGLGSKSITPLIFYSRLIMFVIFSIPSFFINILIDSFYYGHLTWGEIGVLDVSLNNFVVTPLNFIRYNSNIDNLATHGLHPRFLHALVNIPLLFNIIGIYAMFVFGKYTYLCYMKKFNLLPSIRSIKCLMTLSFLVPLALLSVFPHQEPRFLIPLVIPLVYLHGMVILPEPDHVLVEAPKQPVVSQKKNMTPTHYMLKIWIIVNIVLALLYGFVHQGGVLQASNYLSGQMQVVPETTEYHIVTSHIYTMPESFFLQASNYQLYLKGKINSAMKRRVFMYEKGSRDVTFILQKLELILKLRRQSQKETRAYLLIPGTLEDSLDFELQNTKLKLRIVKRFYPHLSFEALPDLTIYCWEYMKKFYISDCIPLSGDKYFKWISSLFALNLYRTELKD